MIRKIVDAKTAVIRKQTVKVGKVDKKILKLISDMKDTVLNEKEPEGVGLAAPQVGKSLQIFVINFEGRLEAFINPKIIKISKAPKPVKEPASSKTPLEGCLSIPHYYGPVNRPQSLTLEYINEDSKKKTEKFKGFISQIIQHEVDHLNGVLFTDHLLEQKGKLFKLSKDKTGDYWEEVDF